MKKNIIPGIFVIAALGLSCLTTLALLPKAVSSTGYPSREDFIKGVWSQKFEKNLNESLPVYDSSRNIWGRAEFALFHEGRKGVVVGADGWLYTDEEFACPMGAAAQIAANEDFIKRVQETFRAANIPLVIAVVPAKSRVLPQHLGDNKVPACRSAIYSNLLGFLQSAQIPAVDLYAAMMAQPSQDDLYLKTDTHWTPVGARLAASTIRAAASNYPDGAQSFSTQPGAAQTHAGDLMRYIPGVGAPAVTPDNLETDTTSAVVTSAAPAGGDSLFGDDTPPITLVGTSYSANKLWNFDGFLKENFKSDVLNMADEGQGPFTVMDNYIAGESWKTAPPKLIIWEMPERYLTTRPEFKTHEVSHEEK